MSFSKYVYYLIVMVLFLSGCKDRDIVEYERVSMIKLLSNLSEFEGKKIEFMGYYADIGYDGPILFYSKAMMEAHSGLDGILLDLDSIRRLVDVSKCEGKRIEIRGILKKTPFIPTKNDVILTDVTGFRDVESDLECHKELAIKESRGAP